AQVEAQIRVWGPKIVGASRIVEDQMKKTMKTENSPRREASRLHMYEGPTKSPGLQFLERKALRRCSPSWYEREVEALRSFNWPPSELMTEDGVLPERERERERERGYSQFNDVSSRYLVSKDF
ncbi:hypothetical protein Tco_1365397, partial [Tanacetum coccineum]